jgi:hypothetical protein
LASLALAKAARGTLDGVKIEPLAQASVTAAAATTPQPRRMLALVLTGPPSAGKTSVMEALSDALVVEDVQHAMIETEALTSAHPALDDDQWLAAVQAVCGLYRRFGYELLLVAATLEADDDLRCLLAAVGADEHAVVRLVADAETLRRRIVEREPEGWSGLDELVDASARLRAAIADLEGVALALSTDGQRPRVVAERIRDAFPRVLRPRGRLSRRGRSRRALKEGRMPPRDPRSSCEPFEPSPSGVAETEHFGSRFPSSEGEPPEDAEHAALARACEECGRELGSEDAGARIGAHRHWRIE